MGDYCALLLEERHPPLVEHGLRPPVPTRANRVEDPADHKSWVAGPFGGDPDDHEVRTREVVVAIDVAVSLPLVTAMLITLVLDQHPVRQVRQVRPPGRTPGRH